MNIMHYDYSDKTTVPTELLQDPYLSVDTKGLTANLCSFGKEAFELSELNKLLKDNISDERIFRELEYSGLIVRRKQGLGKPALITLNYPSDAKLIAKEGEDAQT